MTYHCPICHKGYDDFDEVRDCFHNCLDRNYGIIKCKHEWIDLGYDNLMECSKCKVRKERG